MYKPYFTESAKPKSKLAAIREVQKALKEAKFKISKMKEEEETEASKAEVLNDVIDSVGEAISTAIDELGAGDPAVAELVDVAASLDQHQDIAELEDGEEVFMNEAEEDDLPEDEGDEISEEEEKKDDEKGEAPKKGVNPFEKKDEQSSVYKPYFTQKK